MSELKQIISRGVGIQLDFKTEINNSQQIAATLVAFANSEGGSLFIGVKDSGKIKGIDPSDEVHMIEQAISKYIKPGIPFIKMIWQEEHHLVVEIKIEKSDVKHLAKDDVNEWRSYVRIGKHTCYTNKVIDLAWKLSDTYTESNKYNIECQNEINEKLRVSGLSLSKLYTNSTFSLKEVDFNLSCLLYLSKVKLSFIDDKIVYQLLSD